MRTRAAYDFQCDESDIEVTNVSGTTYAASGCGHTGSYTCSRSAAYGATNEIICVSDEPEGAKNESAKSSNGVSGEKPAQEAAGPITDAPGGAVGFEFGMSEDAAKETCEKAGHQWAKLDKRHAECAHTPVDLAFGAVPRLRFCEKKLCVIQINVEPAMNDGLGRVFQTAYAGLTSKYGPKTGGNLVLTPECVSGRFRDCIIDEAVHVDLNWHWKTGESIALFTGSSRIGPETSPGLFVYYTSPKTQFATQGL